MLSLSKFALAGVAVVGVCAYAAFSVSDRDRPFPAPASAPAPLPPSPSPPEPRPVSVAVPATGASSPDAATCQPLLPVEPSLHGASPVTPAPASDLTTGYRGPGDPVVLETYMTLARAIVKMEQDGGNHPSLARYRAITRLINEQRFYYLGDPKSAPRKTSTETVQYSQIGKPGLLMMFELPKNEFPEIFEKSERRQAIDALKERAR